MMIVDLINYGYRRQYFAGYYSYSFQYTTTTKIFDAQVLIWMWPLVVLRAECNK